MIFSDEASIARRIADRHGFEPGSNLADLVENYADVEHLQFPTLTVDGISLHLKSPTRRPNILINSLNPRTRQLFTLAHEFGHVVIPWHSGTIFSKIDGISTNVDNIYREMEAEANRFAAELLMPHDWLCKLYEEFKNPAEVVKIVQSTCSVSIDAAIIAVNNSLPKGFVYACANAIGRATRSSVSGGTVVAALRANETVLRSPHWQECSDTFKHVVRDSTHYWLFFNQELELDADEDIRSWRDILEQILSDVEVVTPLPTLRQRLNGIISSANKPGITSEELFAKARQKMLGRDNDIQVVFEHQLFNVFLLKRVREFVDNQKS